MNENAKTAKILIVDDDQNVRDMLRAILEINNFEVITASDGHLGIRAARQDEPDLVILDIMMPGVDGMKVLDILRSRAPTENIPIIMLTGKCDEYTVLLAEAQGIVEFLVKPIRPRDLLPAIARGLRYKRILDPGKSTGKL